MSDVYVTGGYVTSSVISVDRVYHDKTPPRLTDPLGKTPRYNQTHHNTVQTTNHYLEYNSLDKHLCYSSNSHVHSVSGGQEIS